MAWDIIQALFPPLLWGFCWVMAYRSTWHYRKPALWILGFFIVTYCLALIAGVIRWGPLYFNNWFDRRDPWA